MSATLRSVLMMPLNLPQPGVGLESGIGERASTAEGSMTDIARLFQAFLAPAIFVSATSLLILSINVRLMGIVSRLRQYVHAKHDAAKNDRLQEAEAYTAQIHAIEQRAEMIRRCFLLVLISLAGTIASCLLLGVRPLLERGCGGGCRPFCSSTDLLAGGNLLLHPRSYRGAEFGAQRSTRCAVHGPRQSARDSSPRSALNSALGPLGNRAIWPSDHRII